MRGYVERMERLAYSKPEGIEPTHDEIMQSYREDFPDERDFTGMSKYD